MSGRRRAPAAGPATGPALLLAAALVAAPAHAGSLQTRDAEGNAWNVVENDAGNQDDYLLRHADRNRQPPAGWGRNGAVEFSLGPDNDTPASLRVEPSGRAWMVGTGTSGGRPQPVVLRITADGQLDPRWGVQGRLQVNPGGLPVRANDLLPLSDGSVLVAGESPGATPKAVVFHLNADGRLDPAFGQGGLWTRPGPEGAVAVSLGATPEGTVSVGVAVRGPKASSEVWSLYDVPPQLLSRDELSEDVDEDDLRIDWVGHRWQWFTDPGVRGLVPPATLGKPAPAAASAANDPGQGAFNPFAEHAASGGGAAPAPADDGLPWGWIALAVALAVGLVAFVLMRGGKGSGAPAPRTRRP